MLHLCNFGIILSFISYTFRIKSTYYFNFFANLFGYLLAMILPNISGDIFRPTTIHYWQNHIYGIALSILGLSLSLFPKPTKKDLLRSIVCFSVYFIIVALIDIRFSYDLESNSGCNIFFLNSSMYSDILHIGFLRENPFVWRINDSFGIEHRIYFLYWPIVYLVYTLLITGLYYVTQLIYRIIGFSKPKLSN